MIGEKCILCPERYPGCQDHCQYGIEAKKQRKRKQRQAEREKNRNREATDYYANKKYRR